MQTFIFTAIDADTGEVIRRQTKQFATNFDANSHGYKLIDVMAQIGVRVEWRRAVSKLVAA